MQNQRKYDLEPRLIEFAVLIAGIIEEIPRTRVGNYIAGQITGSGFSPAFNYGEAQAAESRQDFIHKLKIVLKELRETQVALKLIKRLTLWKHEAKFTAALRECGELIAIFVASIETAQRGQS